MVTLGQDLVTHVFYVMRRLDNNGRRLIFKKIFQLRYQILDVWVFSQNESFKEVLYPKKAKVGISESGQPWRHLLGIRSSEDLFKDFAFFDAKPITRRNCASSLTIISLTGSSKGAADSISSRRE